jgi:hypothetical protein
MSRHQPLPVVAAPQSLSSGCSGMTGVEAVSNGVPPFRRPAIYLARQTLTLIVLILGMLLVGLAVLVRGTG